MRVADPTARALHLSVRSMLLTILLSSVAAGCGGGCAGASAPAEEPEESSENAGSQPEEAPEPPPDPGPRPTLRVVGEPERLDRQVAIRIENRGDAVAELATAIGLQRSQGEDWEDVGADLYLRDSCSAPVPEECVSLAPGGVLLPPAWRGELGDAQCDCERCTAADAGTYRFVIQTCNGGHTLEGEPFELR